MTNRIHLGAIVEREGRILLIRQTPRSPWELPGGHSRRDKPTPTRRWRKRWRRSGSS